MYECAGCGKELMLSKEDYKKDCLCNKCGVELDKCNEKLEVHHEL